MDGKGVGGWENRSTLFCSSRQFCHGPSVQPPISPLFQALFLTSVTFWQSPVARQVLFLSQLQDCGGRRTVFAKLASFRRLPSFPLFSLFGIQYPSTSLLVLMSDLRTEGGGKRLPHLLRQLLTRGSITSNMFVALPCIALIVGSWPKPIGLVCRGCSEF